MRRPVFIIILLVLAVMVCGCMQTPATPPATSVRIDATPQHYSPMMSSTVGIGLTPNVSGFSTADARYEWNASYGRFSGWSAPGYRVSEQGSSAITNGEKIYWSFYPFPESPVVPPVIITLTAKENATGRLLGSSTMTLGWEQNNTFVVVQKIE
ncbi:hypothetical protein [Methanoregula sp.]|uniref:hypothetical protein n=1 Tax=Methanoregula sp. TaxID=2052170 RepID=UPI003565F1E7